MYSFRPMIISGERSQEASSFSVLICGLSHDRRVPENNLPYLHKRPQIRMLLLSALCIGVSVTWMVFRNEDQ